MTRFARFAGCTVLFNLLVIVWGAYVRASRAGDGCGDHWPLCEGQVIPGGAVKTLIEFAHRLTSGMALILVVVLVVWAFRAYPRGHLVRTAASLAGIFIVIEALVGAGLVLLKMVADNGSVARAWWMAAHLANTFMLLAVLTLTWWFATGTGGRAVRFREGRLGWWMLGTAVLLTALGATGAITALVDTLYQHTPNGAARVAAPLKTLRSLHPWFAVGTGVYIGALALMLPRLRPAATTRLWAQVLGLLFLLQVGIGVINIGLGVPIPVQLVHLVVADTLWLAFVLLAVSALQTDAAGSAAVAQSRAAARAAQ